MQAMHIFFKNLSKNIFITINQIDKHKAKYIITVCIPTIIIKKNFTFFLKKVTFTIKTKKIFNIGDTDVNKILVSKKEHYDKYNSFKYITGYNDNGVNRPLYLFISQTTGYINRFDKNKITMSLMIKDTQLLKNYNKIWKKNWKINENGL